MRAAHHVLQQRRVQGRVLSVTTTRGHAVRRWCTQTWQGGHTTSLSLTDVGRVVVVQQWRHLEVVTHNDDTGVIWLQERHDHRALEPAQAPGCASWHSGGGTRLAATDRFTCEPSSTTSIWYFLSSGPAGQCFASCHTVPATTQCRWPAKKDSNFALPDAWMVTTSSGKPTESVSRHVDD